MARRRTRLPHGRSQGRNTSSSSSRPRKTESESGRELGDRRSYVSDGNLVEKRSILKPIGSGRCEECRLPCQSNRWNGWSGRVKGHRRQEDTARCRSKGCEASLSRTRPEILGRGPETKPGHRI